MASDKDPDQVIIRPWPKVVFLYPVMIFCLFCGIWQALAGSPEIPGVSPEDPGVSAEVPGESAEVPGVNPEVPALTVADYAGRIFVVVLCLNILVISFEFSRFKTVAIVFFLVAVLFLLLYLSTRWEVFAFISRYFSALDIRLTEYFYFSLGAYFLLVFGGVFFTTRFNYWVIKSNEILHKEGFLGDVKRYPSPNLKMTKEIKDVFEFLLMGAGKVVLYPAGERQAIVLDHVMWVNSKEKKIQDLLSALSVEIAPHDHDDDPPAMGAGFCNREVEP